MSTLFDNQGTLTVPCSDTTHQTMSLTSKTQEKNEEMPWVPRSNRGQSNYGFTNLDIRGKLLCLGFHLYWMYTLGGILASIFKRNFSARRPFSVALAPWFSCSTHPGQQMSFRWSASSRSTSTLPAIWRTTRVEKITQQCSYGRTRRKRTRNTNPPWEVAR